jgi:hypothetical protein
MHSYENDGRRKSDGEPSFDLSNRFRRSKGYGEVVEEKGKGRMMGMEINDVSRLLGADQSAFMRLRSRDTDPSLVAMPSPAVLREPSPVFGSVGVA